MSTKEELSEIAKLVGDRIEELKGVKSQRDIAQIAGYKNQNMITMIKQGNSKVALERAPSLAKALEVDPKKFFILAMKQFYSQDFITEMLDVLGVEK